MTTPSLRIGCSQNDVTRALFDGEVTVDGFDTTMTAAVTLPEIFAGMMRDRAYDAAELGLTFYLRALEANDGDLPYVAIPAFPTRVFRHSCVFVNAGSGIEHPSDLTGRVIGEFGTYGQDSGVWAKGVLMDEYGFRPETNRWVIGGLDRPAPPFDFIPHPHPADVDVSAAPSDASLSEMIEDGRIDALFTANVPQPVLDGSTRIRRLFPNYEDVERDYHRRTGIFPIMHTVVIAKSVLERHPEAARAVYDALLRSKDVGAERYRQNRRLFNAPTMVPWMNALIDRNLTEFDDDWWPQGLDANRTTLDAFLRHHHDQGLSRRWSVDEIFLQP